MAAEEEFSSESAQLREEIVRLVKGRLEEISSKKIEELGIGKILCKRKRKWRKKHNLEAIKPAYKPVDHHLRQEKESAEDVQIELKDVLFRRRQEAFTTARQLESERGGYHLDSISYRMKIAKDSFIANLQSHQNQSPHIASRPSNTEELDQLLADMQGAMAQVSALRTIRQMKHTMTPRFPPLHNRTLTGNILNTTLGVFNTPDHPQVVATPLDTTSIAPELHEMEEEAEHGTTRGEVKNSDLSRREMDQDEELKTYANVRLSTESVPLQSSGFDQASLSEAANQRLHSVVVSNDPQAMDVTVDGDEDHMAIDDSQEMMTTSVKRSPLKSPRQLEPLAKVGRASPKVSGTPLKVNDTPIKVNDTPLKVNDTPLKVSDTPPKVSHTSPKVNRSSPSASKNRRLTFTKAIPSVTVSHGMLEAISENVGAATTQQENGEREMTEHSYAKVCPDESEHRETMAATKESTQAYSSNQTEEVSSSGERLEMSMDLEGTEDAPSIIEPSNLVEDHSITNSHHQEIVEPSLPTTREGGGISDAPHYDSVHVEGENGSEQLVERVRHHSDTLSSSGLEDEEVLEVTVMEPESDVPIPVEYAEVTQQEDDNSDELISKDEAPPTLDADFDDKPRVVNEDHNETGEAMMIGCEVTTSTMELTDVTEVSGGSSGAMATDRPLQDFSNNISCETVIITTSAMNSSRPEGYSTPSEDSDGTTNSLEVGKRRRGRPRKSEVAIKSSDMISTNDDGTDSDALFEDILKQIETAPYELRISNIVLAQLSRAASKSPPSSSKKRRKRRSYAKKWTRPKTHIRKSVTPIK